MRHTIDLRDRRNRPVSVEIDIRTDTVEFRCPLFPMSSASRDYLTSWLDDPYLPYEFDECTWYATQPITLTIGRTQPAELTGQLTDETLAPLRADLHWGTV